MQELTKSTSFFTLGIDIVKKQEVVVADTFNQAAFFGEIIEQNEFDSRARATGKRATSSSFTIAPTSLISTLVESCSTFPADVIPLPEDVGDIVDWFISVRNGIMKRHFFIVVVVKGDMGTEMINTILGNVDRRTEVGSYFVGW